MPLESVHPTVTGSTELTHSLEAVFLESLPLLKRVIAFTCRRRGASEDEAEEFEGWVMARIVESGYRAFALFDHRSSLKTFLSVVIQRQFSDFRTQRWGRWRPSTRAKRLGPDAVELERLTHRDGFSRAEAVHQILRGDDSSERRAELEELAESLPARTRVRIEREEILESLDSGDDVERRVVDGEREELLERVQAATQAALDGLSTEERLILKLHLYDGISLLRIARMLGKNQKAIYPRYHRSREKLSSELAARGVDRDLVVDLMGWEGNVMELDWQ